MAKDRWLLTETQRQAFLYFWEAADPISGLAFEADFGWEVKPVAVGGSGFGVASLVVAVDRGWIERDEAVARLLKITGFLLAFSRPEWRGGFPHWINSAAMEPFDFENGKDVIDTVETALLIQGLLIARQYFNGPGAEVLLRRQITEIWEKVDWNFFTDGQESGIFWHWSPTRGFLGLKIKGYNEALITYVLAAASPTHPISQKTYQFWLTGPNYRTRRVFGYQIQGTQYGGGPLFTSQYSFVGLNPWELADQKVTEGYYIRGVKQTLSNREYCLNYAPPSYRYSEKLWGLTASQTMNSGYAASSPTEDQGVIAPTAALSAMPYAPQYAMEVLQNLNGRLKDKIWSWFGPRDAISVKNDWVSPHYLAIDQLPIVLMIENYRSGLLWRLFMGDKEIQTGLQRLEFFAPKLKEGFPEAIVTLIKSGQNYKNGAHEIRRHPDKGQYLIPFWSERNGEFRFVLSDAEYLDGPPLADLTFLAKPGRNFLALPDRRPGDGRLTSLTMTAPDGQTYTLPLRLY
ncbi:MAG: beta-glucosidase [Deltaproteobacteria bacterium]|nr:beta-glucosidase [Deltaproteobacteria bacterium]